MGSLFVNSKDPAMDPYGAIKLIGALWIASIAREYPKIRFVTICPGI